VRRWLVLAMGVVLLAFGGCGRSLGPKSGDRHANRFGWDRGDPYARRASDYLQGFMDGYNSAFPERGPSGDRRANPWRDRHRCGRHSAYRAGWESGRHTGVQDERQRQ
jgi:hypothetical protein